MTFELVFKIFQIHMSRRKYGLEGSWSGSYVENDKLVVNFSPKPDFSGFLIRVMSRSGVSFGQVANLLEFILYHMTALPVYMCLDFQASYNFEHRKTSTCVSL